MEQISDYIAVAPKRVSPTTFVEAFARWVDTSSLRDMRALEYLITLYDRTDIGKRYAKRDNAKRDNAARKQPGKRKDSHATAV